jgi:hypothetical protein
MGEIFTHATTNRQGDQMTGTHEIASELQLGDLSAYIVCVVNGKYTHGIRFRFANNQGASVIQEKPNHPSRRFGMGMDDSQYELAVWRFDGPDDSEGQIDYDTPITPDVIRFLSGLEVVDLLRAIRNLPNV